MPTFQHSELLPEHEILQYKIPAATEEANQCSDPEEKQAEHGMGLYQINDWKYWCKLLILRSARVLARDRQELTNRIQKIVEGHEAYAPDAFKTSLQELTPEYKRAANAVVARLSIMAQIKCGEMRLNGGEPEESSD